MFSFVSAMSPFHAFASFFFFFSFFFFLLFDRVRESHTERQIDRQTDTDRQTDRQRDMTVLSNLFRLYKGGSSNFIVFIIYIIYTHIIS